MSEAGHPLYGGLQRAGEDGVHAQPSGEDKVLPAGLHGPEEPLL